MNLKNVEILQEIPKKRELMELIFQSNGKDFRSINSLINICKNKNNKSAMPALAIIYHLFPSSVKQCLRDGVFDHGGWRGSLDFTLMNMSSQELGDLPITYLWSSLLKGCAPNSTESDKAFARRAAKGIIDRLFSTNSLTRREAAMFLARIHGDALDLARRDKDPRPQLLSILEQAAVEVALEHNDSLENIHEIGPSRLIEQWVRPYREQLYNSNVQAYMRKCK